MQTIYKYLIIFKIIINFQKNCCYIPQVKTFDQIIKYNGSDISTMSTRYIYLLQRLNNYYQINTIKRYGETTQKLKDTIENNILEK